VEIACTITDLGSLHSADHQHLVECFAQHFGHVPYAWAQQPWRCLAKIDGELVGHLSIVKRTVVAGSAVVDVGGIGGVTTHQQWRRRGVAGALLARAAQFMHEELRVPFGLLICRPAVADVYASRGWHAVPGETHFEQPSGTVTYPGLTMTLRLQRDRWPSGDVDLQGLPW
jgi:GNAT superfamily N-acetyltransferase